MSNYRPNKQEKIITKKAIKQPALKPDVQEAFTVKYATLWLVLAALVVYFPTFFFKFTELDDTIFVHDFHAYNEDIGNLITSFSRGVFDAIKDPYYRPLFLDSMIINYKISDGGENIAMYHIVNVLFHIINVVLLFKVLTKLAVKEVHAFVLALVFAVHPVLSQAVSWIPGRNDTILALFSLSFFLQAIKYSNTGKAKNLGLSFLFLLLAYFTKETAVFVTPVAFIMLVLLLNKNWKDKLMLTQYGVWFTSFVIWFAARYFAIQHSGDMAPGQVVADFVHRLPLIVQYTGKIFLPFNLSVFPIQEDTVHFWGLIAIWLIVMGIYFYKKRDLKVVFASLGIFMLFLIPALLVPTKLNEQTFEHRLYLPMIGILLLLTQTVALKNRFRDADILGGGIIIAGALAIMNFQHQRSFKDPLTFWTAAAATSPHSAYANMMLAAREDNLEESYRLFRKAYKLNPKEKYLNFYYGVMLQKQDSVAKSEQFLLTEKNTSGYYECDFYLARVAMERKDLNGAIDYLQTYLKKDASNKIANNNLLLLYLDTQQRDKAAQHAKRMRQLGLDVPPQLMQQLQ